MLTGFNGFGPGAGSALHNFRERCLFRFAFGGSNVQIYCIQLSCDFHNKLLCLETFQVYLSNKSLSSPIQIFPILVEFIAKNTEPSELKRSQKMKCW